MDYEFWLRLGRRYPAGVIAGYLANFRMYDASKSGSLQNPQFTDELRVAKAFSDGDRLPICCTASTTTRSWGPTG